MSERLTGGGARAIGRLRALLRATEQIKVAQNQQQLWYYLLRNESAEYDAIIPVTHDPALVTE